jgi:membrane associated rhomboid family serine protease
MIQRAAIIGSICLLMLVVHGFNALFGGAFNGFGIQPRDVGTLHTILTAPWLHGDANHLFNNLWAFAIFGSLCMLNGPRIFLRASLVIIVLGGGLLWLFGRDASHIGASGWVFGLWSFAIAQGWFERSPRTILIAILVVLLYGGVAWGMLPTDGRISFEGHIFGALAGVFAAYMVAKRPAPAPIPQTRESELKFWS